MNVARALTWASRAFFGLGLVLFASLFVYMATRVGSGASTSSGETVSNVSAGDMRTAAMIFTAIAWSFLCGAALRTLVQSTSWPRALLSIAELIGFGVIFVAPIYAISGSDGMAGALACFLTGFAVVVVSRIAGFVAFGAKEAAASAGNELARLQGAYRQAQERNASLAQPPSLAPPTFSPPVQTFMPEPPSQEPPRGPSPTR